VPAARVVLWVASVAGLALAVRSVFIGPVPLAVAIAAAFIYLTLIVGGVLSPQLGMFGDVIWQGEGSDRTVALTFDDGPNPATTPHILDVLAREGVHATFFVLGHKVDAHPEIVADIVRAGHDIGVHGYHHYRLYALLPPRAVEDDIRRTREAVRRASGYDARYFRPPVGQVSPRTAEGARRADAEIVVWSVRGIDGLKNADPDRIAVRIERGLRPGAIVLMHDAAERDDHVPASLQALPRVLHAIRERKLTVVPLTTLIGETEGA
jgi:peptidoglycan/xylan/chitin deacetylase (PgdA/CDA1 family)